MICDQFDVLYEDGAKSGRVMSICLHPFLIGHPHRSKYLDKALAHIRSRQEVWVTRGAKSWTGTTRITWRTRRGEGDIYLAAVIPAKARPAPRAGTIHRSCLHVPGYMGPG